MESICEVGCRPLAGTAELLPKIVTEKLIDYFKLISDEDKKEIAKQSYLKND